MKLYHYTAGEHLRSIAAGGLWKGEVPVSRTERLNAVWLTGDHHPGKGRDHGLTDGRPLDAQEKRLRGLPRDAPDRHPNKRAVRLTVAIPHGDRNLVHWHAWARGRLHPTWLTTLEAAAGGPALARTWFLYWGVVPVDWITEARHLLFGVEIPWPPPASGWPSAAQRGRT
jgi:hypothetical protein